MRYWNIFTGSFHSTQAYTAMRYRAKGLGLSYSFMLVAVTTVLLVCFGTAVLDTMLFTGRDGKPPLFDDLMHQIGKQWPGMELKDGVLIVHAPQPYYIGLDAVVMGYRVRGDVLTIDTTGKTTPENMGTPLMLNRTEIVTRSRSDHEIKVYPLNGYTKPGAPATIITPTQARAMIDHIITIIHATLWKLYILVGIAVWLVLLPLFYILRIIMLLAVAGTGMLFAKIHRTSIDFSSAMRLAAMAYTPVAVIDAITLATAATALPRGLLFLLTVFLLSLVLRLTRTETTT